MSCIFPGRCCLVACSMSLLVSFLGMAVAQQTSAPPQATVAGQVQDGAMQAAAIPSPMVDPFRLTESEKQRLDNILGFWETRSSKVKTYSCDFTRLDYDAVFGPADSRIAKTKSVGIIRYAAPDKGEFKVEQIGEYKPPVAEGGPADWPMSRSDHEEHWICDGLAVFELNGKAKQLREERLPPEMQGKGITNGPLPFLFGAKKDQLLEKYWLKEIVPPDDRPGEYWIDARPKTREDAANFQRILVILDEKQFLPIAMQVFPPGWEPRKNWSKTTYVFQNRQVNHPLHRGQEFLGEFISPDVPRGWKKVVTNFGQAADSAPLNAQRMADDPNRR